MTERRPLEAVMVGAGNRGYWSYGPYARLHPDQLQFVAVAEPDDGRRERFADEHGISQERRYRSWEELAAHPQLGQAAINTTMDRDHVPSTLALLRAGYHVLLEKPMATAPAECVELARTAKQAGRVLQICHVLRYAPFFRSIYDVVRSGRLGDIVSLDWRENLAYSHFAHSFVRGRWANTGRTAPMILTKCCHDLDQLVWILQRAPQRVASFGALRHFRSEAAPTGAPARCTDGCPVADECPYEAQRFYLNPDVRPWAQDAVSLDHRPEAMLQALREGPYGRCVYRCDNDAVENQAVLLEYEGGLVVNLTMQGGSHVEGRTVRIDGMRATLLANQPRNELVIHDHRTGQAETVHPPLPEAGHGGGDAGIMAGFVAALRGDEAEVLTAASESLESHLLAFAAEEARVTGRVIDMQAYRDALPGYREAAG